MKEGFPRPSLAHLVIIEACLGALFLVGIGAFVALPGVALRLAGHLPEYADLRGPLLALSLALTAVGLVVLAVVALLVHRLHAETMVARSSLVWMDALVISIACAVALIAWSFLMVSFAQAGTPALALAQVMTSIALITVACITLRWRSRLRHAISVRNGEQPRDLPLD